MSDEAENTNTNTNTAAAQAGQATADNQPLDETINGRPYQMVPLETPIKRAGGDITEIKVMKPLGGDLRGLSIKSLADMDALSVQVLLPRITQPSIIQAEANALDFVDLANCAGVVWDFLQPSSVRKAIRQ